MVTGISIFKRLGNVIRHRGFTPYLDTRPLRLFLESALNVDKIRNSDIEPVTSAVYLLSSKIAYFNNGSITVGYVMANTPIAPALERDVSEIVVVLLSPVGGADLPLP